MLHTLLIKLWPVLTLRNPCWRSCDTENHWFGDELKHEYRRSQTNLGSSGHTSTQTTGRMHALKAITVPLKLGKAQLQPEKGEIGLLLTGGCTKVWRLEIIPQLGNPWQDHNSLAVVILYQPGFSLSSPHNYSQRASYHFNIEISPSQFHLLPNSKNLNKTNSYLSESTLPQPSNVWSFWRNIPHQTLLICPELPTGFLSISFLSILLLLYLEGSILGIRQADTKLAAGDNFLAAGGKNEKISFHFFIFYLKNSKSNFKEEMDQLTNIKNNKITMKKFKYKGRLELSHKSDYKFFFNKNKYPSNFCRNKVFNYLLCLNYPKRAKLEPKTFAQITKPISKAPGTADSLLGSMQQEGHLKPDNMWQGKNPLGSLAPMITSFIHLPQISPLSSSTCYQPDINSIFLIYTNLREFPLIMKKKPSLKSPHFLYFYWDQNHPCFTGNIYLNINKNCLTCPSLKLTFFSVLIITKISLDTTHKLHFYSSNNSQRIPLLNFLDPGKTKSFDELFENYLGFSSRLKRKGEKHMTPRPINDHQMTITCHQVLIDMSWSERCLIGEGPLCHVVIWWFWLILFGRIYNIHVVLLQTWEAPQLLPWHLDSILGFWSEVHYNCYNPSNMNKSELHFTCKNESFISFDHPIDLFFFIEMMIIHISYGHHFMTCIFFFYILITLRMWIKVFLLSLHKFLNPTSKGSINPDNISKNLKKTNTTPPNNKSLVANHTCAAEKKNLVWVNWWWSLEGQKNIFCTPILLFSSLEDEPLLLPLSLKAVFKSKSQHALHNKTYFFTWLFLKALGYQLNGPSSPKNWAKLYMNNLRESTCMQVPWKQAWCFQLGHHRDISWSQMTGHLDIINSKSEYLSIHIP
ncbi:putative signal peptide protein [Puccinia sorghi]|uniref:Putative signal peptide protein n=1 Tax=Puccinia sorghi TaxID=27349 RepID=A0A0L6V5E4_9BASI|nr:putative signal peptide protein [Puccinia sorghi]